MATLPYAQTYDMRAPTFGAEATLWPGMIAAIYDGASVTNLSRTSSSITPHRSTGNCVFPEFASLAICSQCANATHLLNNTSQSYVVLPNGFTCLDEVPCFNASIALPSLNLLPNSPVVFIDASFLSTSNLNI